jgi:hypothetical protein
MPKWPLFAVMLVACGVGGPDAPMIGDCTNCGTAPVSGGGISGGSGADASFADVDAANFDATENPDSIDIVDVGVPSDFDALINP